MKSIQERITDAYQYRKTLTPTHGKPTKAALAKAARVTASAVSQWFDGHSKSINGTALLGAADYLGISPGWLAGGLGPMVDAESQSKQSQALNPLHQATIEALTNALHQNKLSDIDCINLMKDWLERA